MMASESRYINPPVGTKRGTAGQRQAHCHCSDVAAELYSNTTNSFHHKIQYNDAIKAARLSHHTHCIIIASQSNKERNLSEKIMIIIYSELCCFYPITGGQILNPPCEKVMATKESLM